MECPHKTWQSVCVCVCVCKNGTFNIILSMHEKTEKIRWSGLKYLFFSYSIVKCIKIINI